MADWGALFVTESGAPFLTPQATPLALYAKQSVNVSGANGAQTVVTQTFLTGKPIIPFVVGTSRFTSRYSVSGNVCTVILDNGQSGTADVYFFSIFPQNPPSWGFAVWGEDGNCILTNETRVLTDVTALGVSGDDAQGGYNINTTLSGKWGVVPGMCGLVTGVINDGGTRPYQDQFFFHAQWNGSSTVIKSASQHGQAPGGVANAAYHNMRNQAFILNLANYD